ncbi:MAG: dockerin type I domain-containing protein [Bacteroidales bacterium]
MNIIRSVFALVFILNALFTQAQLKVSGTPTPCNVNAGKAFISDFGVAMPPLDIRWSNGKTTASIDSLKPGKYTVQVKDARQCRGTGSYEVKRQKGGLSVSLQPAPNQNHNFPCGSTPPPILLIANASGGLGSITYSPGKFQYARSSGTYRVSARDQEGFCTGSASITISITPSICSRDPNEIIGPVGTIDDGFVAASLAMPYTILFENDPDLATAPAQKVVITHAFDPHINRSSLKLGDFGFSNMIFNVPPNTSSYSARLDLRDSLGFFVDLTAGINVGNNTAFWIFQTIDPATGLPPVDPTVGFLPINDSTHKGEGFVSYNVTPRITTQSGDSIKASASIVFDINEAILTNTWFNIADAGKPASSVNALNTSYDTTTIEISFSSEDDSKGSGVESIELWYAAGEDSYTRHGTYPPDTVILFTGDPCTSYRFFSIAIDRTGNMEEDKEEPDTQTTLMPQPTFPVQPEDQEVVSGETATFSLTASGALFYQWEASNDGGITFSALSNDAIFNGVNTPTLLIQNTPIDYIGFLFRCLAGNGSCSDYSRAASLHILTTLSGKVVYDNDLESPLTNTPVYLSTFTGSRTDSTLTNMGGSYYFLDADPGEYLLETEVSKPWGGVNATDALRVLLHFTNQNQLSGHHLEAGDVNHSGGLNAIDALLIARRFAGIIDSFPTGDWYAPSDTISLGTGNQSLTQRVLCYGDVNGSNIPALRTAPLITLDQTTQAMTIQSGDVFELPILTPNEITAGAISLVLSYPRHLFTIEDVRLKNPAHATNLTFSAKDGILRIAWYSLEGLQFDWDEAVVILSVRASEKPLIGRLSFTAESLSEISDPKGKVLENVELRIPELRSAESTLNLTLAQNHPNPFLKETEISYYLPEAGKVSLKVFNPLGQLIAVLTEEIQQEGHYTYPFTAKDGKAGVYAAQLVFENQNGRKVLYKLMTKAH